MQPDTIVAFLHELCAIAERETLPRFREISGIDNKRSDGFDPVTEADKQAELAIRKLIFERYPDHGIIGEEYGNERENAEYCWIIDPVDGTRAFISGVPVWGTLIGLYRNGEPFAGVMHQPFTGEKYYSEGSVTFYERDGKTNRLSTQSGHEISDAILMTTAPELFAADEKAAYQRVAAKTRMARYGADCYAYCQLAAGHIGLVIESGLQPYDIAALIPIVENAGGRLTNWQGESAANGGQVIAAANEVLHSRVLELLNAG